MPIEAIVHIGNRKCPGEVGEGSSARNFDEDSLQRAPNSRQRFLRSLAILQVVCVCVCV